MNEERELLDPGEETLEFEHEGEIYDNENPMPPGDERWVKGMRKETERNVVFLGLVIVGFILLLVIGTFVS